MLLVHQNSQIEADVLETQAKWGMSQKLLKQLFTKYLGENFDTEEKEIFLYIIYLIKNASTFHFICVIYTLVHQAIFNNLWYKELSYNTALSTFLNHDPPRHVCGEAKVSSSRFSKSYV